MNYMVIVFIVFACLDGYFCKNGQNNPSHKISARFLQNNLLKTTETGNNHTQNNDIKLQKVQFRENALNHKISKENVLYAFGSGGENSANETDNAPPVTTWEGKWTMVPTVATFSLRTGIPISSRDLEDLSEDPRGKGGGGFKVKKKYQKYLLPLLLAYKLKFFTLIPVMIGGLILLVGATGLAGFFFALFAAVMGLKGGGHGGH